MLEKKSNFPKQNKPYRKGPQNRNNPKDIVEGVKSHFGDFYHELLFMEDASDIDVLDAKVKKFVENNYRDVTSSQLRNIYAKIKPIRELNKLKMQRPKLAYIIARQNRKTGALNLMYWFDDLIRLVKTDKEVKGFKDLMESVVAYHKYFEILNSGRR